MTNPPPTAVGAVPPWAAVWLQQPLELSLPPLGGSALYTFGRGSHSWLRRDDVGGRRRRGREALGVGVAGVTVHMSSYEDHAS